MKIGDLVRLTEAERKVYTHRRPERIEPMASAIGLIIDTNHPHIRVVWTGCPVYAGRGTVVHLIKELEVVSASR